MYSGESSERPAVIEKNSLWMRFVTGPRADLVIVDRADRRDLGRRAREEDLVGEVEVGAHEPRPRAPRSPMPRAMRMTVSRVMPGRHEAVVGGVYERAVAHDEDVLARPVGQETLLVEQDRLVVARVHGLHLRELRVEVLAARLGGGGQRVRADAAPRGGHHAHAVLERLLAEVGAPGPDGDDHVDRAGERVDAELAVAAERERPHVAGVEAVDPDRPRASPAAAPRCCRADP